MQGKYGSGRWTDFDEEEAEPPAAIADAGWTDDGDPGYEVPVEVDPHEQIRAMVAEEANAILYAENLAARTDAYTAELDAAVEEEEQQQRPVWRTGLDGLFQGANPFDPNDELPSPQQIRGLSFADRARLEQSQPGIIEQCQAKWQWELRQQEEGGRGARRAAAESERLTEKHAAQQDPDYQLEVARQKFLAERGNMTAWNRQLLGQKLGIHPSEW